MKRTTSPGSFRQLIGTRPYCSDPAWNGHTPPTPRQTITMGPVTQGGVVVNAHVTATTPPVGMNGHFTVADNNFATGWSEIILGDLRLINGIDYQVGAGVNQTATAIATAITRFAGFSAVAVGPVVTVTYQNPMDEVEFRVRHRGTHTNFTTLVPSTGFLSGGDPVIGSPVLT